MTTTRETYPAFRRTLRQLCATLADALENVRFSDSDDAALMALVFAAKQLDHAKALLLLGSHPDCALVCRSMLEGLVQLKWALASPQERARRWRVFSLVTDWRLTRQLQAEGITLDRSQVADVEARLAQIGDELLTAKARKCRDAGTRLPDDPYIRTWHGTSLKDIFEAVRGQALYQWPYREFAAWHHWGPDALGQALRRRGRRLHYSPQRRRYDAGVLVVAFQCVYETAQVVDQQLALGISDTLSRQLRSFLSMARSRAPARR